MERWMLIFPRHFFKRISYTCNSNHSVYDWSVHTLTCCTHIFLSTGRALRTSAHFSFVSHTHGSSSWKRCVSLECLCSLSRLLPSHVSPVCAVPTRLPWHHLSVRLLVILSRPESAESDAHTETGFCQTCCFTCLQNPWHSQSIPHLTDSASDVSFVTGSTAQASRCCLRVLWSGQCTTLRERNKDVEFGCFDERDSLSHYNECPLLYNFFVSILFHDLITQLFSRSLQYGMAVMGVIDAFVHAHNPFRRNMDNLGNFGDGMKGRIRFMTAITPAYAHA